MVVDIYNQVGKYRDFCKHVAEEMSEFGAKVRPVALMQAINPNYDERPFFFMRALWFLIGWIRRYPRSGMWLLHSSVIYVLHHSDPTNEMRRQAEMIEEPLRGVKKLVSEAETEMQAIPATVTELRQQCRDLVGQYRAKKARHSPKRRRRVKRIKQPPMRLL